MRPTLLMLHGWGFDASIWDALCACLAGYTIVRWDRGYFGSPAQPPVSGPLVAIGHSLGALLLAQQLPPEVPLVAINGFDRFIGPERVPARVMWRMQARFAETPRDVLTEFRARCGAGPTDRPLVAERLAEDLAWLAAGQLEGGRHRVLALHGRQDPILPSTLRHSAFPGATYIEHDTAGHLLPLTHAAWCAAEIEQILCR